MRSVLRSVKILLHMRRALRISYRPVNDTNAGPLPLPRRKPVGTSKRPTNLWLDTKVTQPVVGIIRERYKLSLSGYLNETLRRELRSKGGLLPGLAVNAGK